MSNLFKLYRRGTDGTPTLFMPDQTTIGSSLGNVDLHADLASLASKEYVVDTIDNLNKSNLAGRVDTYGDLPNWQLLTPYVAPELSSPGEPMVDDYSVSVQHPLTELGESGDPHRATTVERTPNMSLIMHPIPNYFAMVFKQPLQATKLKLVNRTPSQYSYGYHLKNFSIEAKAPSGWVELYRGINTNQTGGAEFEFDIVNTEFYHEYRLNIIDVYPGSAGDYFYIDLIQLSGNVSSVAPDGEVGAIYLVGTEGNLEEYIFTEWGTWERIGEIRQSDVDLSGYTTTEGMIPLINTGSITLNDNIDIMHDDVTAYLDELRTSIEGAIVELPIETQFLESEAVPTVWPEAVDANGMVFVLDPLYTYTEYTAPVISRNGTPYLDEYAVSSSVPTYSNTATHMEYSASNDNILQWWHTISNPQFPLYYNMYFKEPTNVTSITIGNREIVGWDTTLEFTVEASLDGETWVELYKGSTIDPAPAARWEITLDHDGYYKDYRLNITKGNRSTDGVPYVVLHMIRPKGFTRSPK